METTKTLATLQKITDLWDTCQSHVSQICRFPVDLISSVALFNRAVLMALMKLENYSFLQIMFKDTLFSAAVFLEVESANDFWISLMYHWVTNYSGFPKAIHLDLRSKVDSDHWLHLLQATGIYRLDSWIETHNAIRAGNKYYDLLRRIFRKVLEDHSTLNLDDFFSLYFHAMNKIGGPDGLVLTILVFRVVPQVPITFYTLPEKRDCMKALYKACREIAK